MMNSFVSLQKDVALVSLIGPVEILRQAGIDKAKFANFTPYVAASLIFLADHHPVHTARRPPPGPRAAPHRRDGDLVNRIGGSVTSDLPFELPPPGLPLLQLRGVRKSFGSTTVLDGIDLDVDDRRRDHPDRRVGIGQVDAAALHQPARAGRRRHDPVRRRRHRRARASMPIRSADGSGWSSRASTCSPT